MNAARFGLLLTLLSLGGCRERADAIDGALRAPSSAHPRAKPRRERPPATADALLPKDSIWGSRAACERALASGGRLARRAKVARLGSWNVRWYPDGRPGRRRAAAGGTDLAWLACAIAWLDVDALAVQEFKAHSRAQEASAELVRTLDRHTGGTWKLVLDDCRGGDASQHVGILYDAKRVRASQPIVLGSLNPHGDACKNQLRPGLALNLRFAGGLDLFFVSVHFKSGSERRSLDLRARSIDALPRALRELEAHASESDVVIAGDFNTMGCNKCSPPESAAAELGRTSKRLAELGVRFRRVEPSASCTEYFSHGTGLLDHFVVTAGTSELSSDVRAKVTGFCGDAACKLPPGRSEPSVSAAISDHCPIVLELDDRDLD